MATDLGAVGGVTDVGDGTYTATLTAGSTTGTANITGTLGGPAIGNPTTVTLTAVPPPPEPDPTPTPDPTPATTADSDGVTVEVTNAESTVTSTTELTAVTTTADDGSSVSTTIPAGALPAGSSVEVSVVSDIDSLVEQAPPPEGVDVTLAFSVTATDSSGDKLTDDFASPVTLTFTVDASSVPDGASLDELVMAFWNGSEWVVVEGTAVLNSDGSVTLTATVDHFTLFAVLHRPVGFVGDAPASGSIGLLVTSGVSTPTGLVRAFGDAGCAVAMLAITESGAWRIFISGAPAQVNALFPATLAASTPFFVRCA